MIGVLALLFGGRWEGGGPAFGPLSSVHSGIEVCVACHPSSSSRELSWIPTAFAPKSPEDHNAACIACHDVGPNGGRAHLVPPETLQRLTTNAAERRASEKDVRSPVIPAPDFANRDIACATCHSEHQGRDYDLVAMTDERCQACHIQRIEGLGASHPEFTEFPGQRQQSILFDHATHYRIHIPEKFMAVTIPCNLCHQTQGDGRDMGTTSFEKSCDACHGPEVNGKDATTSGKGIPFLSLPALDLETLRKAGVAVDGWPAAADGVLTPFMVALLSGESGNRELLDRTADLDLGALKDVSKEGIAAVDGLLRAIERLALDLRASGAKTVDDRLSISRIRKGNPPLPGMLVAGLTQTVVDVFIRTSLPHLAPQGNTETGTLTAETWKPSGGWFVEGYTLYYRPVGHNDVFSRAWFEYLARFGRKKSPEALAEAIDLFRYEEIPGKCAKCHATRQFGPGADFRGWGPRNPAGGELRFTDFSHNRHLHPVAIRNEGVENCRICHKLAEGDGFAEWYVDPEQTPYQSNFVPIPKERCAVCHDGNQVVDRCTRCHAYHVRPVSPAGSNHR